MYGTLLALSARRTSCLRRGLTGYSARLSTFGFRNVGVHMKWILGLTLVVFLSWALIGLPARGQSSGAVQGIVSDESRAVVPGAKVRLTEIATHVERETTTTYTGAYAFPFLAPRKYRLVVSAKGFREYIRDNVVVNVAEPTTIDVVLSVGQTSEQVTVTGEAPLVQSTTSALGRPIDESMLTSLPLSSRNFTQVLGLTPGVMAPIPNAGALGRNSTNIAANGARLSDNSMVFNGLIANNHMTNGFDDANDNVGVPVPAPDAIEEFKVQTGLYDAEFGRQGGAIVNVVTKSGTINFHGAVYEYLRNDDFNANEFFLNSTGQRRPELKQNQFGGQIGGPIKKDKLFFFASYQGTRQRNGVSTVASVFLPPLTDIRSAQTIGAIYAGQSGIFGGATVASDGSNVNPAALAILNAKLPNGSYLIPKPQTILPNGSGFSVFAPPAKFSENQGIGDLDYSINTKHRIAIKTFIATLPQTLPFSHDLSVSQSQNILGFGETDNNSVLSGSVAVTYVFSSNIVNQLRFGYSRFSAVEVPILPFSSAADFGITPAVTGIAGIPQIAVSGGFSFGPANNNYETTRIFNYQIADTLSFSRGRHQLRVGGDWSRDHVTRVDDYNTLGSISFQSYPDFILGMSASQNGSSFSNVGSANASNGITLRHPRMHDFGLFAQDDFRATEQLTFNLGLRYQFNGNQSDANGYDGAFFRSLVPPGFVSPASGTYLGFVIPGNANIAVPNGFTKLHRDTLIPDNWLGFSPRVGVAWAPFRSLNNFVVRAGYGIYWSAISGTVTEQAWLDPWYMSISSGGSVNPNATFQNPFIPALPPASAFPLFVPYTLANTRSTWTINSNSQQPYNQQWSASAQYGFKSFVADLGYVGSKSTHLGGFYFPNQANLASPQNPINGITTNTIENINARVPVLGWTPFSIWEYNSIFDANYNALQASLQRRIDRMTFLLSYTWSHSIDDLPINGFTGRRISIATFVGDANNLRSGRGNSDFDVRNRLVFSYSWNVPGVRRGFLDVVTRDWTLSGLVTIQSGLPFSVTDFGSASIYGVYGFAQFAPGADASTAKLSGGPEGRLQKYFNTSAFTSAPAIGNGTGFGNSGRNILPGPGEWTFDAAVARVFRIREKASLEFRIEAFNLFNHPDFGLPGSELTSPGTFGVISSTVVNPRILQLALKLRF